MFFAQASSAATPMFARVPNTTPPPPNTNTTSSSFAFSPSTPLATPPRRQRHGRKTCNSRRIQMQCQIRQENMVWKKQHRLVLCPAALQGILGQGGSISLTKNRLRNGKGGVRREEVETEEERQEHIKRNDRETWNTESRKQICTQIHTL